MDRRRRYLDSQPQSKRRALRARVASRRRARWQDARVVTPLEQLLTAARAAPPRTAATRVVAIDGRSGSGKSTLARALARELDAPLVALEDLYGGWEGLEDGVLLLGSAVLRPLAAGRATSVPRYDWHAAAWGDPWRLAPPEHLIVEGVGAGARSLAPYTSVLVWLELRAAIRRERALARRYGELYAPHWQRWALQEDAFFERERPLERADLVIDAESLDPRALGEHDVTDVS
jgi:pantothenate kinase-related protein Tda10